eukprot:tig00021094_g18113.t1
MGSSLTPRGLDARFCGGGCKRSLDSGDESAVEHDIYVWNGKNAAPVTRACALTRGFELEKELERLRESSRKSSREQSAGGPDAPFAVPLSSLFPGAASKASLDAVLSGQGLLRRLWEAAAHVSHVPAPEPEAQPREEAKPRRSSGGARPRRSFRATHALFFASTAGAPPAISGPSDRPGSPSRARASVPSGDGAALAPSVTYAQVVARSPEPRSLAAGRPVEIPRLALAGGSALGGPPPVRRLSGGGLSPHSPEPPTRTRAGPGPMGFAPLQPALPGVQQASGSPAAVRASPRTPRGSRASPRNPGRPSRGPPSRPAPPAHRLGPALQRTLPRTTSSGPSPRVPVPVPPRPSRRTRRPTATGRRRGAPAQAPAQAPLSLSLGAGANNGRPGSASSSGAQGGGRAVLASRAGPPPALDLAALQNGRAELTERQARKLKFEHFNRICSQITDFLYLASNDVASNRATLAQHGITHVLNCAGGDCAEHFPDDLIYRTLYLSDSPNEDISCYFYDVIEFIDAARRAGGRVLVHCYQGVSRSSSMVIGYLMYSQGWRPYDEVYQGVKEKRGICNPNTGFVCQLLQWRKRCMEGLPDGSPPRLYLTLPVVLSPGQYPPRPSGREGPVLGPGDAVGIVSREVSERDRANSLDSRGCAVLHTPAAIYVWTGAKCHPRFRHYALERLVPRLTRFEKAPGRVEEVSEGAEPPAFWEALGGRLLPGRARLRLLAGPDAPRRPRAGLGPSPSSATPPPSAKRGPASPAMGVAGRESRGGGRLLEWPNWEPLDLFDTDDLADDKLFCLLVPPRPAGPAGPLRRPQARVWLGDEFDIPESWEGAPADEGASAEARRVAFARWAGRRALERLGLAEAGVEVVVELQGRERDDFWAFFELG